MLAPGWWCATVDDLQHFVIIPQSGKGVPDLWHKECGNSSV